MTLPTTAIETGYITRYRDNATLQGLLGNPTNPPGAVFDMNGVPVGQSFPYVVVGILTEQEGTSETMAVDGVDSYMQVSVFTQSGQDGGFAQARAIAAQIYALTNRQPLNLSAQNLSQFFAKFKSKSEEGKDGITQHIPMIFHLMTQG